MSKTVVTVFLCTGKSCSKAWKHICHGSPRKWLKQHVAEAELPYKLNIIRTECMDNCEEAANCCFVHGDTAVHVENIEDADQVLAELRTCVERQAVDACHCRPPRLPSNP